ncbi:MAG: hypothetical protein LBQ94_07220 [Treponema sp.]|jgi:hypothetical protein|nr:hypothetical protein [Treponema sp.]
MKNLVFKRLLIAAIFCALAFSACKQESDPQKIIIVTGIPATHNGRYAVIKLFDTDYPIAENRVPASISNGTATISLDDLGADGFPPFTESGIFWVLLSIRDTPDGLDSYSGIIDSMHITEETTTIRFSEFRDISQ